MFDPNNPGSTNPQEGTGSPYGQPDPYSAQQYTQYIPPQDFQYSDQQNQYEQSSNRTQGLGSAHKDRWVAVILAFFLGMFGLHKFYLGYKSEGTIMLVVGLIGGCCFGLGTLVMTVIAWIEAVRYLVLTQEDFERTYVYGSKGWL